MHQRPGPDGPGKDESIKEQQPRMGQDCLQERVRTPFFFSLENGLNANFYFWSA
ncbi:hypothetical protein RISK_002263 [Rhodopirellula islandica]|uniref:Uncharacterized protein n=1 Tax=Rhodopirellula islandica TaxID=595434 RepID=A0A0J1BGG9_RHOIS|nr:hypothetical protein RISK_002263 [Rhodopirellula islandica]